MARKRAANREALGLWLDESLGKTGTLVEQRETLCVCVDELQRQVGAYSTQLSGLIGRVWSSENRVVARLTAACEKLEAQMARAEKERQAHERKLEARLEATRKDVDDAKMELAVTQAALRQRESETAAARVSRDQLERETTSLRQIIAAGIQGVEEPRGFETDTLARDRMQTVFEMDNEMDALLRELENERDRQASAVDELARMQRGGDGGKTTQRRSVACHCALPMMQHSTRQGPPPFPDSSDDDHPLGKHVPVLLRKRMRSFPQTRRIPTLGATLRLVLNIQLAKLEDAELPLAVFAYEYFEKRYGAGLADEHASQLVRAIEHHANTSKRARLFHSWLGLGDKDAPPAARDANLIATLFWQLRDSKQLTADVVRLKGDGPIDVSRSKAVNAAKCALQDILPDRGAGLFHRIDNMPPFSPTTPAAVDLDDLLEIVTTDWADVHDLWRKHAHYLFDDHAPLFQVREEMRFADDTGQRDIDSLLVQVDPKPLNFRLRPARLPADPVVQNLGRIDDSGDFTALLTKDAFRALVRHLDPYVAEDRVDDLFDRGCAMMREHLAGIFATVWNRYSLCGDRAIPDIAAAFDDDDDRGATRAIFWHSPVLDRTQWTPPFDSANFRVSELDRDTFTELCLDARIFATSPFSRLLATKLPDDLWPNSDAYLARIEDLGDLAS